MKLFEDLKATRQGVSRSCLLKYHYCTALGRDLGCAVNNASFDCVTSTFAQPWACHYCCRTEYIRSSLGLVGLSLPEERYRPLFPPRLSDPDLFATCVTAVPHSTVQYSAALHGPSTGQLARSWLGFLERTGSPTLKKGVGRNK